MTRFRLSALAAVALLPLSAAVAAPAVAAPSSSTAAPTFDLVGRYANGGAEVSAVLGSRLYVIGEGATLDIVDISDPSTPALKSTVDLAAYGAGIISVAAKKGYVAVAIPAADKTDPGTVVLLDAKGTVLRTATVGANPDMLVFDEGAKQLVVANEGEPNSYTPQDDPARIGLVGRGDRDGNMALLGRHGGYPGPVGGEVDGRLEGRRRGLRNVDDVKCGALADDIETGSEHR